MPKVSLTDFVAETLASISDGVRKAQEHSRKTDGVPIAPNSVDGAKLDLGDQLVKFHVAVEAEAGSGKKATGQLGGAFLAVVTGHAAVEGQANTKSASQHTIEFAIPMHFHLRWAARTSIEEGTNHASS